MTIFPALNREREKQKKTIRNKIEKPKNCLPGTAY